MFSKKKPKKNCALIGLPPSDRSNRTGLSYKQDVIAKLLSGSPVVNYREGGGSMEPRIHDGQYQTLEPIKDLCALKKKDIVLCKVRGNIFTHQILTNRQNHGQLEFLIGNNHGGVNGWTRLIYGKSTERYWDKQPAL